MYTTVGVPSVHVSMCTTVGVLSVHVSICTTVGILSVHVSMCTTVGVLSVVCLYIPLWLSDHQCSVKFKRSGMECKSILFCRRIIGRFYMYTSVFLPCIVGAACALLVERKSRRPLLAGYVATVV